MHRLAKFVLLLPLLPLAGCATVQSISNTHGPAARSLAHLSHAMSITFVFATVVMWTLLTIAFKKRRGNLQEHMPIDVGGGQLWIAIGGLAIPLLVLSIFFFFGLELLSDFPIHGKHGMMHGSGAMTSSKPDIVIIGHQWWWEVHYINGPQNQQVITANEIHIPINRPINIELHSADVLHSFWVPSLHGKVDLVPGQPNYIRIEASEPADLYGQCGEYCGEQHANMHLYVVAQKPGDYDAWLANQAKQAVPPANPQAVAGQQAFLAGPCASCHMVRGTQARGVAGPDLTHIGSRRYIGANTFDNNVGYLEGWITHAQGLKPGCKMPDIKVYSGVQLRDLTAYLKELQ